MKNVTLCSRVAAVLMILMLLCQFLPYWQVEALPGASVSVNGMVWFPTNHPELTEQLKAADTDYNINSLAYPTVAIFLLCVFGAVAGLWKSDSMLACFLPVICGGYGLWTYLTTAAFKAGGLWWLHVLLLAAIFIAGTAGFVFGFRARD